MPCGFLVFFIYHASAMKTHWVALGKPLYLGLGSPFVNGTVKALAFMTVLRMDEVKMGKVH